MWLLILSILCQRLVIQAIPVYTFNGSSIASQPSFAYLVKEVQLPDAFILCSSVKQARFDDVSFWLVSGQDSLEWMRMDFRTFSNKVKLKLRWGEQTYILGNLQNPKLDFWYHICISLDLTESEIEVAVNGDHIGGARDTNLAHFPQRGLNLKSCVLPISLQEPLKHL